MVLRLMRKYLRERALGIITASDLVIQRIIEKSRLAVKKLRIKGELDGLVQCFFWRVETIPDHQDSVCYQQLAIQ